MQNNHVNNFLKDHDDPGVHCSWKESHQLGKVAARITKCALLLRLCIYQSTVLVFSPYPVHMYVYIYPGSSYKCKFLSLIYKCLHIHLQCELWLPVSILNKALIVCMCSFVL